MDIFTIENEYADKMYDLLENKFVVEDIFKNPEILDDIKMKLKEHRAVTLADLSDLYMLVCMAIEAYLDKYSPKICSGCGKIQTLKQQGLADLEEYFALTLGEVLKKENNFTPNGNCEE